MFGTRAKNGSLAWLLLTGALATGCEEWLGEEEEEDASTQPSVPGDAAIDSSIAQPDAGPGDAAAPQDATTPQPDAALPDAATPADAAADATPGLDAAPDAAPDTGAALPDASEPDAAPGTELPCDVEQVLIARCQSCHGSPPTAAPIPLVTLADLKAASTAGGFVYQRVQVRIDSNTMPPSWAPSGALTATEKTTLTSWIAAGAPGSNNVCP